MTLPRFLLPAILALAPAPPAEAQTGAFAPVARVNDSAITRFELDQRAGFLRLLRVPGDVDDVAMEQLVDERLQFEEAERQSIEVDEGRIRDGMEEFAGRTSLSVPEFLAALEEEGVAEESFRDFVRAGLAWRDVVQRRFGSQVELTDSEVDRAIELAAADGGVRVLVSEIFLPADTPEATAESERLAAELQEITSVGEFSAAARRHSTAPSFNLGGRLDWIPVGELPSEVRSQILTLAPGQVSDPIPVHDAIALFQMRGIEEIEVPHEEIAAIDFARYLIPGAEGGSALAEAERVMRAIDTCDDLNGIALDQPEERLERVTSPIEEIAGDVAAQLAGLDDNEVSTELVADGDMLVFLMLCGRTAALGDQADREAVRRALRGQRLEGYASGYLSELRSDATIQYLK